MKKLRIISIIIAACIIVYTLVGFFVIPMMLESMLPKRLGDQLHRKVSIGNVHLNPYTLMLAVQKFAVKETSSSHNFIAFDRLMIDVAGIASIRQKGLVIKDLSLEKPGGAVFFDHRQLQDRRRIDAVRGCRSHERRQAGG